MKVAFPPVDIASLSRLILSPDCQSVLMLTGAGVSVAASIPDFRSPGGLYDTLQPDLLTATENQRTAMKNDPTKTVSAEIFRENQFPYLELRRPFILGTRNKQWKATIAHRFAELLHLKTSKLRRLYTQNIDSLDFQCTGIPTEKIVTVHGTIAKASCEGCERSMEFNAFCDAVQTNIKDIYSLDSSAPKRSKHIPCPHCGEPLVKPSTVLYGGVLPAEFFECAVEDLPEADLLIVAGTSLEVSPANRLVDNVPDRTIRVIVNNEPVGQGLGIEYNRPTRRDFFAQGQCDEVFLQLIIELGWFDDFKSAFLDVLPEQSAELVRRYDSG